MLWNIRRFLNGMDDNRINVKGNEFYTNTIPSNNFQEKHFLRKNVYLRAGLHT